MNEIFNGEITSVTIFSNTKLREILNFLYNYYTSPIPPVNQKSKFLYYYIFSNTFYFAVYTITVRVACSLSLYKPLIQTIHFSYVYCVIYRRLYVMMSSLH